MKLLCSANSPYARKVRVSALELDVADRIELVDTDTRDPSSGLREINALGKVPTLVLDDGTAIYDSPVICEYLNAAVGDGRLTPEGFGLWRMRTLVALADGIMDAGMAARLELQRPEGERSVSWIAKQLDVADRGVEDLQTRLLSFANGIDLAAIAAACAIFWIGFRHPDRDWLGARPALARWFDGFAQRPSMRRTAPEAGL